MALIPFDDRDGLIWMNGEMIPWRDARTHSLTHALHYASQVFDGERAYSGKIFKSREHTERLRASCQYLDFDLPLGNEEFDAIKAQVLDANDISDGYVRAFCWRGSEMMAISAQETKIHVAVAAWQWPSYFDPEPKMKGIKLDIADWKRPSAESAPVHAKAAGLYMICTLSKHTDGCSSSVKPEMVSSEHPLASIKGATNAITYSTELLGDITLIGPGAGRLETGYAVIEDILSIHKKSR